MSDKKASIAHVYNFASFFCFAPSRSGFLRVDSRKIYYNDVAKHNLCSSRKNPMHHFNISWCLSLWHTIFSLSTRHSAGGLVSAAYTTHSSRKKHNFMKNSLENICIYTCVTCQSAFSLANCTRWILWKLMTRNLKSYARVVCSGKFNLGKLTHRRKHTRLRNISLEGNLQISLSDPLIEKTTRSLACFSFLINFFFSSSSVSFLPNELLKI